MKKLLLLSTLLLGMTSTMLATKKTLTFINNSDHIMHIVSSLRADFRSSKDYTTNVNESLSPEKSVTVKTASSDKYIRISYNSARDNRTHVLFNIDNFTDSSDTYLLTTPGEKLVVTGSTSNASIQAK